MRKRVKFSIAGLVLAAAAVGLSGWAGAAWVELCRCEVRMDGAWIRLDNGYRHRLDLARDLTAMARTEDGSGADPAHRLRKALAGLERFNAMPVFPDDQDRYSRYLALQRRLGDVLAEFAATVNGVEDREMNRLCGKLADLDVRIRDDFLRFDRSMKDLIDATRSFPGSLLAKVVRMKQPGNPGGSHGPILAR